MNMNNRNFVSLFLIVFALIFGGVATTYPLARSAAPAPACSRWSAAASPLIGLITVIRSRYVEPVPLSYSVKNIAIILASLCGFVLISHFLNMLLGIVFLVFCSTLAGTSYSVVRNVKISVGLIAVAFAFKHLLGLGLPIL